MSRINMPANISSLLSGWYGSPLTRQEAERLKSTAESRLRLGQGCTPSRLANIALMRARFWLAEFGEYDFTLLSQGQSQSRRLQGLMHLAYGQLLIARKLDGAFRYLDRGLRLADGIIRPQEYFNVYNRHESLRTLRLSDKPSIGLELQQLLNEAGVIDKITQAPGATMTFQPARFDTLINKFRN